MFSSWIRNSPTMEVALKACRRHFGYAALFSALLNLLIIAPMLYMLQVYERVLPTQGKMTLLLLTLGLVIALATMALLETIRSRLLVRAGLHLDALLASRIMRASLSHSDPQRSSRQSLREFDTLRQAMTGPAMHGLFDAPWVPIYTIVAFLIHPWVGVLSLFGTVLILALAWRSETATRVPLQRAGMMSSRSYAAYDATVTSADVVRSLGLNEALVRGHTAEREAMLGLQTGAGIKAARLTAESKFVRMLLQSLALGVGALLAVNGEISAGAIFASMFIVGRALAPIDQLIGGWRTVVQARGAIHVIDELLARTPPTLSATWLPKPRGRLDVEGMSVAGETSKPILHNVSFRTLPGEVVAIVGPSGAGKSTLVRCLAGAQAFHAGFIRYDTAEIRDWNPDQLAEEIGFMPQETVLFAGSIKDNITRFQSRLTMSEKEVDEAAVAAATLAGAHEMILLLPGGYDHQLPIGGRGLSAGQAQRIALARALFRSPRYILLDEPNASLDAEGDTQLTATLEQLKAAGTTILVVAHRLSLLPVVDKLLVLRDGRVAMFGPRDEVIRTLRQAQPQLVAQG
jgi:ATP-binding cassette subfamily C protein